MNIRQSAYEALVNRDDGIKKLYLEHREAHPDSKGSSLAFLLSLNARKYILHSKIKSDIYPDEKKTIKFESESESFYIDPSELINKIEEYDVISLDVFDTLLLRKVENPADVFYLIQDRFDYPGMKNIRTNAEKKARQIRNNRYKDFEVTIDEIWDIIEAETGIDAESGKRAELEAEKECCYYNPFFERLMSTGCFKGKTVIICSDTYWHKEEIEELLIRSGITKYEEVIVSCQHRKSKAGGELFRLVKEMFPDQRILHIGDNRISDIKNAEKQNIATYYYRNVQRDCRQYRAHDMSPLIASAYSGIINAYLHNGSQNRSREFELGFIYGGLFAVGYCQFIKEYAESQNIDKILFLSRDGDILKKVYDYLYPEHTAETKYVYWSRLAGIKASAEKYRPMFTSRMVRHKSMSGYTVSDCFKTMEISDLMPDLYKEKNIKSEDILDNNNVESVSDFINEHWNNISGKYCEQAEAAYQYINEIVGDSESIIIVDVGWAASSYFMIKDIINTKSKNNCRVKGVVAGTAGMMAPDNYDAVTALGTGDLISYIFSPLFNRAIWKEHDVGKGHNLIMEILLCSDQPSLRSFCNEEGNFEFEGHIEYPFAVDVQEGIMTFTKIFKEHPFREYQISGSDAYAPISLIKNNKKFISELIEISNIRSNLE